jgi:hypothetical protein
LGIINNKDKRRRKTMTGLLTNQQRSKEYYRLSYQCLQTKAEKKCDGKCAFCSLNVHLYVDDPRDATLIKTSAAVDYLNAVAVSKQERANDLMHLLGALFSAALAIALVVVPVGCVVKSCKNASGGGSASHNSAASYSSSTYNNSGAAPPAERPTKPSTP